MKKRIVVTGLCGLMAMLPACESDVQVAATEPAQTTLMQTQPETTAETLPPEIRPEPADTDFVRVTEYIPSVLQELMYATDRNFTGQVIYDFENAYLRYGTVKKLKAVSEELAQQGLYLKIWDGFRPVSAQFKLWEVLPDPNYVANPTKGYSSHSRGNTLDVTIVDAEGRDLEMPTGFDDFSAKADRDYSDCTEIQAANAMLLETVMEKHGFHGYFGEWWHFYDNDTYPVEENFAPIAPAWYYADCEEFISLHTEADVSAEIITWIPAEEEFQVMALYGDYALADYRGIRGYVLRSYIQPVQ